MNVSDSVIINELSLESIPDIDIGNELVRQSYSAMKIPKIDLPSEFPEIDLSRNEQQTTNRDTATLLQSQRAKEKIIFGGIAKSLLTQGDPLEGISKRKTILLEFIHTQFSNNALLQCLLSMASILTGILEYEHTVLEVPNRQFYYYHTHKIDDDLINDYELDKDYFTNCRNCALCASCVTFVLSILLWITIFFDSVLYYQITNSLRTKNYSDVFLSPGGMIKFIINILVFLPSSTPMTFGIDCPLSDANFHVDYHIPLNSILTAVSLFRLWYIFKYYLISSETYTQRSFRFCKINGVKFHLTFPFKANMHISPLIVDSLIFVIFLFLCSYNNRIFERYLDPYTNKDFGNYLNDVWYMYITMTTVGFGDLFATTVFGRIFSIIGCIVGVLILSFSVVSVSNYLDIRGIELNAYNVIERSYIMEEKRTNAENMVCDFMIARKTAKKKSVKSETDKVVKRYRKKIRKSFDKYKNSGHKLEKAYPIFNQYDSVMEYLRFLEETVSKNKEKIDYILRVVEGMEQTIKDRF